MPGEGKMIKTKNEAIIVEQEPVTNVFIASRKIPRTPPQQRAHPGCQQGPSSPPCGMLDFSTTEDELMLDGQENKGPKQLEKADIVQALRNIREKVQSMKTKSQSPNTAIKEEILEDIEKVINAAIMVENGQCGGITHLPPSEPMRTAQNHTMNNDRIAAIESDLQEIKATLKEALGVAKRGKTWAQVAAQPGATVQGRAPESTRKERLEKLRREKAKSELLLTMRNASEQAKATCANTSEENLTKGLQKAIADIGLEPAKISAVKKTPSHGLRICCSSEEAAKELRKLDWEKPLEGARLVESLYGIVVHGVPKASINFECDAQEQIKFKIEQSNLETIKVARVTPLRKRAKNPDADMHSIVIFTANPHEADDCILYGINIGQRHHAVERYIPQCQIKQCFKCQGYGHIANICTRGARCGKCGQDHETKKCSSESLQCIQCKGPHAAWHHECPARQREYQRLEILKEEISPTFEF